MKRIRSESEFICELAMMFIKLPFYFVLILAGRKKPDDLITKIKQLFKFFFEPKLTIMLISVNVFVFMLEMTVLPGSVIERLAFKPSDLYNFNIFSIISSMFLHASFKHLTGNMIFLYIFGRIVEKEFNNKMLWIYFGSGLISMFVSGLFHQGGIGASGAVAGLISTAILYRPFYITFLTGVPLPIFFLGWVAIFNDLTGILSGTKDNIGHIAHLAGYLAITLLVFTFNLKQRKRLLKGLIINFLILLSFYSLLPSGLKIF